MLDSHRDIRGHRDWDIHRFLRFPRFSGLASITSCRCAVVVIFFVQRDHGSHSAINKCQAPFTPSRMLSQLRIRVPCHRPKSPRTPITSHVSVSHPRDDGAYARRAWGITGQGYGDLIDRKVVNGYRKSNGFRIEKTTFSSYN